MGRQVDISTIPGTNIHITYTLHTCVLTSVSVFLFERFLVYVSNVNVTTGGAIPIHNIHIHMDPRLVGQI